MSFVKTLNMALPVYRENAVCFYYLFQEYSLLLTDSAVIVGFVFAVFSDVHGLVWTTDAEKRLPPICRSVPLTG